MKRTTRGGFTLLEMMAVLAVILIIGAVVVPTLDSNYGNTRQKSAADTIRARLSDARSKAMEKGTPFRVAIHQDKDRVRLAPDGTDFASGQAPEATGLDSSVVEDKLAPATAEVQTGSDAGSNGNGNGTARQADDSGWVTVAVLLPDGSCRPLDDNAPDTTVVVREKDFQPLLIEVRGLTGQTRIVPAPAAGGKKP